MTAPRNQAVINGQETAVPTTVRTLQNYVGGRWVASEAARFGDIHNPATDELIARVPLGTAADVDRAVEAAQRAFPAWRATPPVHRVTACASGTMGLRKGATRMTAPFPCGTRHACRRLQARVSIPQANT